MNNDFIAQLKTVFAYDQQTGVVTWDCNRSRARKGSAAGCLDRHGYVQIQFMGKRYFAHRVAWAIFYSDLPDVEIDHKNGVKNDNRISNLRAATRQQNSENRRKPRAGSKSGLLGVSHVRRAGGGCKWRASIMCRGVKHVLGEFDSKDDAHIAYMAKKRELHAFSSI